MTHFSQIRPARRAPRVSLRGNTAIAIHLENGRQLSAKLHQLSVTGGLLEVATFLEERVRVSLKLQLGPSVICPQAEMLFPMRGTHAYLQPFWFTRLYLDERQTLEREIGELLKKNSTPLRPGQKAGLQTSRFYLESF